MYLIDDILTAQGNVAPRAAAGADRGVLIVAARGPMCVALPRTAVKTKSSENPGVEDAIRQLQGMLRRFNATREPG